MFKSGDLVVYSRPHPDEVGEVFQVESVMEDDEGVWVLLVSDPSVHARGYFPGLGCWELASEFVYHVA